MTKIKELKKGDRILDHEGLVLIVKSIVKMGKRFSVTVNYEDKGFYRCNDTVKTKNGNSLCIMAD